MGLTRKCYPTYFTWVITVEIVSADGLLQSARMPVTGGADYHLSAWLRGEIGTDGSPETGGWQVRVRFFDANHDEIIGGAITAASGGPGSLNTDWRQEGELFMNPAGAVEASVELVSHLTSGWVAFDDVALVRQLSTEKYYYSGTQRVAMDKDGEVFYLLGDHLGSTSIVVDGSGDQISRTLYRAWGEVRYSEGASPTDYLYTGQRWDAEIGLYFYNARWYDPSIGRFTQADTDVPESQGDSGNSVGSVSTYSPLVVDYHESRYLEQLNSENRTRFQNPDFRLSPVPTSSIVFDRYAYSLNNPVRYVDPDGHFAILAALALVTPVGWVAIGVTVVAVGVYFAVPGVREAVTNGIAQAGETASNGLNALFAKGEYVPPSIKGEAERNAYREAVHAYKDAFGLGAATDIEQWILDEIARLLKEGVKPEDIPYQAPQPPEEDDEMEDDYE